MSSYDYGNSVISSNLRYEFKNDNVKYAKIKGRFKLELKLYCGTKKMVSVEKEYFNVTINTAIKDLFKEKIENRYTFHKGKNYYAVFNAYELKPVIRPRYKKTDTYIKTERRKYLLRERINIYF